MTIPAMAPRNAENEFADQLFWLSRLDGGIPRASVLPDFSRPAGGRHAYLEIPFTVGSQTAQVLKSLDTAHGVSDLVLCVSLFAVLLAKYHLHEAVVVGLRTPSSATSRGAVVPLAVTCRQDHSIADVMRATAAEVRDILSRTAPGAARMAQVLSLEPNASRCAFFDVAVSVGEGPERFDFEAYPVDLAFLFDVDAGHIRGRLVYAADLYAAARMDRLVSHFTRAAAQLAAQPLMPIADIEILADDERRRILHQHSGRSCPFQIDGTLSQLFEARVRQTPDAIAVVHRDTRLTYADLDARANRLATTLLSLGLEKGQFAAILLHRGCDFLTAVLAVFKAGGAYVPLDPTYPRERVRYMLEDSEAAFVISNAALIDIFGAVIAGAGRVRALLSLEGDASGSAVQRVEPPLALVGPDAIAVAAAVRPAVAMAVSDRAYMIYTSGSSGRPKGAICRHDGALNHLYGELEGLGIDAAFSFLQTAASSSDISVWQFMAPLVFGGATVVADYDVVIDPAQLFAAIRNGGITLAELVPVVLRGLLDHIAELPENERALPDLRFMMATGEGLPTALVNRWLALYPGIPVANTYGPTETSDDVTLIVLREPLPADRANVPIGRPLPNVHIFLLDRNLRLMPEGVPGEICVAGVAVGEGYWRQPEKTAAAFVRCPFPEVASGSMYRTGDLGRWLPDGCIEFLGRVDQQVKVRGFRVEPGEVEAVLIQHAAVQDAAVVAVKDPTGTNRLVAYYVARREECVKAGDLRLFLKSRLADHMVPAALMPLTMLPLTPLGKVDRKALMELGNEPQAAADEYVAPRNELERLLAATWSTVLGRRWIGVHDNFLEIGGESISTIHIIAELRKSGLTLAPKAFFLHPTIAELAARLARPGAHEPASTAASSADTAARSAWDVASWRRQLEGSFAGVDDVYPLGATQRGIYLQTVLPSKSSGAYIEQIAFDLAGRLDEEAFGRAWQYTVNTTEALRSAVTRRGVPRPMQVVVHCAKLVLEVLDWLDRSPAEQKAAYDALVAADRRRGFDLRAAPLTRVTLIRLSSQRWRMLWTYHHIILDGWSEPLVLNSVSAAYNAFVEGRLPRAESSARYREFVAWAESQDDSVARSFWQQRLSGYTEPVSIKDGSPGVEPPASDEISHGSHEILLDLPDANRLEAVTRRDKVTFGTLVHGAWALLLHQLTASNDVVFGSVASGRQCALERIETMRGVLVVTQPVRSRMAADATVSSWLRSLQLQLAEIREFEHTSLGQIQQWCDVPVQKRPLFDTIVVLANYTGSDLAGCRFTGLELTDVAYYTQPLFALTLFVVGGPRPSIRLVYDKKKYAASTVQTLLENYRGLLQSIAENSGQRVGGLMIPRSSPAVTLPNDER
jgi:amino acid adenylation domain-containing protein